MSGRNRIAHGRAIAASQQECAGNFYRRMRANLGAPKAITASAHKLARIIYTLVTTGQDFDDSRFAADQLRYEKRQEVKLRAKAQALGFQLIPVEHPEVVP